MAGEQNVYKTIKDLPAGTEIGGRSDWGNKLVVNTGTHPVANFNFMLRVEGLFDLPCKSIRGIQRENEFDYIQEGGLNDYVHLKRKPISKPFTFQVERYVGVNWIDPLPLGTELVLPLILFVNKYSFPGLNPVRTYTFTGCTVTAKEYGELNAEASGLLVEKVTIAYREMICLDIPSETLEKDTWKFNGKEREGQGERRYNSNLYNKEWEKQYNSKAEMEKRAKLSKFAQTPAEITPKLAKHIENETAKTAMEANAEKERWKPEKDTDGSLKTKHGNTYEKYVTDFNAAIDKQIGAAQDEKEKVALTAMKKAANGTAVRKYEHSATAKKYSSAKYDEKEATKAAMEANAEKERWKPEKDTDGSLKTKHGNTYEKYVTDFNTGIDKQIEASQDEKEKAALTAMKKAANGTATRKYEHSAIAKKYSSAKHDEKEKTRADMETAAKKYEHSATAKKYSSAKHDEKEATKAAMEANAEKERWKPEKDTDGSLKTKHGNTYEKYVTDFNTGIDKQIEAAQDEKEKAALTAMKKAANGTAAKKYEHSATAKKYSSAKYHKNEPSREAMEAKAKKWSSEEALKEKSARPEPRLWPKSSSANTKEMKKPEPRLWPKSSSANTKKMKKPEPRLWPKKRSARQITDFLKKH